MKSFSPACFVVILFGTLVLAQTNPVPQIYQPLIPASAAPGGPGFTLTVNGAGFVPESVVNWNGSPRATTFVNASQLTGLIVPSDIATAGTASITVLNLGTGAVSNVSFFQITVPTGSASFFATNFPINQGAQGIATGDFDKNGKLDLAVNAFDPTYGGYAVYILLGNGDGTFGAPTPYDENSNDGEGYPMIGDFDGDGKLDLALPAYSPDKAVIVLLGNGDGSFGPPLLSSTAYQSNGLLAAGDFNSDGELDLSITTDGGIEVLLGNGDGTFQSSQVYPTTWTVRPICTADFNGDGKLDLAVGGWNGEGTGTLQVYLGNGDGTFQSAISTSIQPPVSGMLAADFNGDGTLDIATTTGATASAATLLLGNGNGTFQAPNYYETGAEPVWLADGDLNGDGNLDLVTANQSGNTISVLLGNGDGTFQANSDLGVGKTPNAVAAGDFNGDGRLDLAVGNFQSTNFTVLSQTVNLSPPSLNFGTQPVGIASQSQVTALTNVLSTTLTISSISITGPNQSDFTQTNNCGSSLPPGGTCDVSVTFTPSAVGERTGAVSVADDAPGSPHIAPLSGVGTQPAVMLSPSSLDFGNQTVRITSMPRVATLTNTGNGSLTITSISVIGGNSSDFSEVNDCGTSIPPGGRCNITVTFTPMATGTRTASVSISDDAPDSPQLLPLTGIGVLPAVTFSPTSLAFATQVVFTTSPAQKLTLTNTGLGILRIISWKFSGPFGGTTDCGKTLAPGASCTTNVVFKPKAKGPQTGSITLKDNASDSPQKVLLSGTGTYVQLNPTRLNFGNQPVGSTSLPKYITLRNKGSEVVNISGISITGANAGDFAEQNNCGNSVASGASCKIKVTFTPTAQGKRTAAISISDDGGGSPQTVPLTGAGTP